VREKKDSPKLPNLIDERNQWPFEADLVVKTLAFNEELKNGTNSFHAMRKLFMQM